MKSNKVTRRTFLRAVGGASSAVVLAACAPLPTPEIVTIKETVGVAPTGTLRISMNADAEILDPNFLLSDVELRRWTPSSPTRGIPMRAPSSLPRPALEAAAASASSLSRAIRPIRPRGRLAAPSPPAAFWSSTAAATNDHLWRRCYPGALSPASAPTIQERWSRRSELAP